MAAFREAEARSLDLDRAVSALVQGRSVSSADDIAALLHGRVTKWIKSADSRRQSESIMGLGPAAAGVTDPEMERALQDRRRLIEHRARALALSAIARRQSWTLDFGRPPEDSARREEWLRRLGTVAAYRERWQVNVTAALGGEPRTHVQKAHWKSADHAVSSALAILHTDHLTQDVCAPTTVIEPGPR